MHALTQDGIDKNEAKERRGRGEERRLLVAGMRARAGELMASAAMAAMAATALVGRGRSISCPLNSLSVLLIQSLRNIQGDPSAMQSIYRRLSYKNVPSGKVPPSSKGRPWPLGFPSGKVDFYRRASWLLCGLYLGLLR